MISDINSILKRLELPATGHYDDHFYIIPIENSNDYAKMYTKLSKNAINTEYPSFGTNTNKTTIKVTNYFEVVEDGINYDLFLVGNFIDNTYYLKIKEHD